MEMQDANTPEDSVRRFPTDGELEGVILGVLREKGEVSSLNEMTSLVNARLASCGFQNGTTNSRVRRMIIDRKLASVKVKVRRWDGQGLGTRCPVCGHGLRSEKNDTIYGWKITLKQICPECGYWTDRGKTSVARYTFFPARVMTDDKKPK